MRSHGPIDRNKTGPNPTDRSQPRGTMPINTTQRLERYLIRIIEDENASRKDRMDAAKQLTQLKVVKMQTQPVSKPAKTASNNVLGTATGAG